MNDQIKYDQVEYDRAICQMKRQDHWHRYAYVWLWLMLACPLSLLANAYLFGWWVAFQCLPLSPIVVLVVTANDWMYRRWSWKRRVKSVRGKIIGRQSTEEKRAAEDRFWGVIRSFVGQYEDDLLALLSRNSVKEVNLVTSEWGSDRIFVRLNPKLHDYIDICVGRGRTSCVVGRYSPNIKFLNPPRTNGESIYPAPFLCLLPSELRAITVELIHDRVWPSDVPDTALSRICGDEAESERGLSMAASV